MNGSRCLVPIGELLFCRAGTYDTCMRALSLVFEGTSVSCRRGVVGHTTESAADHDSQNETYTGPS